MINRQMWLQYSWEILALELVRRENPLNMKVEDSIQSRTVVKWCHFTEFDICYSYLKSN